MIPEKKSLLFYGELPPAAVHGIAISNMINIKMLEDSFDVEIIEEQTTLNKHDVSSTRKLLNRAKDHYLIVLKAVSREFDFFYLTFSISGMGALKTLFSIMCFRLFNRGQVLLHIHRGDFFKWYNKNLFNRTIARLVMKLTTKVIVLSETQREPFLKFFSKPVYVLHNTVEREYDYPLIERKNSRFIYISNYLIEKGIIDLLEVFSRIIEKNPEISLHTFGAFPSEKLKEHVLKYQNPRIFIGDIITGNEKFIELERADCLILPSYNEGEPIVLLEAMSLGTPIIATQVGLVPEMLGEGYPFCSSPGNQDSLEKKIIQFVDCQDKKGISKRLKERYTLHYSNRKHRSDLISIFS